MCKSYSWTMLNPIPIPIPIPLPLPFPIPHPPGEIFLLQVTGRLARELRLLRPQDAARLLQAIDRLGLVEPRLLRLAAELVPARLAKWQKVPLSRDEAKMRGNQRKARKRGKSGILSRTEP